MAKHLQFGGYDWITSARYGRFNTKTPYQWYADECVNLDKDCMLLDVQYEPRKFERTVDEVLKTFWPDFAVGCVHCTEHFGFGTFEAECILPKGTNLWPAFWLSAWGSWPPEMDVFEGYSNSEGKYRVWFRPQFPWIWPTVNIEACTHYDKEPNNKQLPVKRLSVCKWKYNPTENIVRYKVVWTPDVIQYFYDDKLVTEVKDTHILEQFAQYKMCVIFDSFVQSDFKHLDLPLQQQFIVKSFKYTPYVKTARTDKEV
jgi:hypothetical protein